MEEEGKSIEIRALDCLGLGFDFTSDFRLKFAKGNSSERLVIINETNKKDIVFPSGLKVEGVSADIQCDKGDRVRFKSDILEFNQMSELLNQKASVQGKVPSGYLNAVFDLSGHWLNDASDTKCLAFDAYFIALYHLHLTTSPLALSEKVRSAVPSHWDPAALSRFIRTYGTHIVVGMAMGGQDLVCVKQKHSSTISSVELRQHLEDLGDNLFSHAFTAPQRKSKQAAPEVFSRILQANTIQLTSVTETSSKDGLTVIWSKRGGDVFSHNHSKWLQTVAAQPDAVLFKFVPLTSLLNGVVGSGYLSHAINLYLRYKPVPDDLHQFLEFQIPTQWAPLYNELPLAHMGRRVSSPSLQSTFMGPKIRVSPTQVLSDGKPVVGLRLYLEGRKCDRLAVHVQHLSSVPPSLQFFGGGGGGTDRWRGSDDYASGCQYVEPIKWRKFSRVCTSTVEHDPKWLEAETARNGGGGAFVVIGAQLLSKGTWPSTVLHLRLLFTYLPNHCVRQTSWAAPHDSSRRSSFLVNLSTTFTLSLRSIVAHRPKKTPAPVLNSGVYVDAPPVPSRYGKLLRFVDMVEVSRGPHDTPGHWLVTAARLVTDAGKIALHVKFALLDCLDY